LREEEPREAAGLLGVGRSVLLDFTESGRDDAQPAGALCAADPADVTAAVRAIAADGHYPPGRSGAAMTAAQRPTRRHTAAKSRARATDLMIQIGIPHDRYTVAFHADTCQIWILDTACNDEPRGLDQLGGDLHAYTVAQHTDSNRAARGRRHIVVGCRGSVRLATST
jgi:hypothetical protein